VVHIGDRTGWRSLPKNLFVDEEQRPQLLLDMATDNVLPIRTRAQLLARANDPLRIETLLKELPRGRIACQAERSIL
jgi:hypothetical protein